MLIADEVAIEFGDVIPLFTAANVYATEFGEVIPLSGATALGDASTEVASGNWLLGSA